VKILIAEKTVASQRLLAIKVFLLTAIQDFFKQMRSSGLVWKQVP